MVLIPRLLKRGFGRRECCTVLFKDDVITSLDTRRSVYEQNRVVPACQLSVNVPLAPYREFTASFVTIYAAEINRTNIPVRFFSSMLFTIFCFARYARSRSSESSTPGFECSFNAVLPSPDSQIIRQLLAKSLCARCRGVSLAH